MKVLVLPLPARRTGEEGAPIADMDEPPSLTGKGTAADRRGRGGYKWGDRR